MLLGCATAVGAGDGGADAFVEADGGVTDVGAGDVVYTSVLVYSDIVVYYDVGKHKGINVNTIVLVYPDIEAYPDIWYIPIWGISW